MHYQDTISTKKKKKYQASNPLHSHTFYEYHGVFASLISQEEAAAGGLDNDEWYRHFFRSLINSFLQIKNRRSDEPL